MDNNTKIIELLKDSLEIAQTKQTVERIIKGTAMEGIQSTTNELDIRMLKNLKELVNLINK